MLRPLSYPKKGAYSSSLRGITKWEERKTHICSLSSHTQAGNTRPRKKKAVILINILSDSDSYDGIHTHSRFGVAHQLAIAADLPSVDSFIVLLLSDSTSVGDTGCDGVSLFAGYDSEIAISGLIMNFFQKDFRLGCSWRPYLEMAL